MNIKLTHISNLRSVLTRNGRFITREQQELLKEIETPLVNHPSLVSYTPPHHSFSLENRERLDRIEEVRDEVVSVFDCHEWNVSRRT